MATLGDYAGLVRRERARRGYSTRELASEAGVLAATVSRFERGHETALSHVLAIMGSLGLSLLDPPNCKHEYACRLCGDPLVSPQ